MALPDAPLALSVWWMVGGGFVVLFVLVGIIGNLLEKRQLARKAASGGTASMFPLADASGHLICRYCGKVFTGDGTTVQRARDFYAKGTRRDLFVVPCLTCGKPSLFLERDVREWRATV
jgi:hypothetical protein